MLHLHLSDNHCPCATLSSAALFVCAKLFLSTACDKAALDVHGSIYLTPDNVAQSLMLHDLCTQSRELCYQSPAVLRRELLWLAGKWQASVQVPAFHGSLRGSCTPMDCCKEAGCRHIDRLEHKKMPFVTHKQMDSAREVQHFHCTAMFAYISHNKKNPPFSSGCLSFYFYQVKNS